MARKHPYRNRQQTSIAVAFTILAVAGGIMAGKDCMRFYRRDIMQVWRIPQGSGLCNVATKDSWFNVQAGDNNLHFKTGSPPQVADMQSSYSQRVLYDPDDSQAVLLNLGGYLVSLTFSGSYGGPFIPYTTSQNDDSGMGFSRYYL